MPSASGFKSLEDTGADFGVVACHDGTFYSYRIVGPAQDGLPINQKNIDFCYNTFIGKGEKAAFDMLELRYGVRIEHIL